MTVGIYSIRHVASGKRYVGKSVNVEKRLSSHKCALTRPIFSKAHCNRHLWAAVQKHGWQSFTTEILEEFCEIDEQLIGSRELFWMDHFQTCDRRFGYNLRRDTSTKMIVHDETRALHSQTNLGEGNPNYGNTWSDEQRLRMSNDLNFRRLFTDSYGDEWRKRIGEASKTCWQDNDKRLAMAQAVKRAKQQKYEFLQYSRDGELIRIWDTVEEILTNNPNYKWQNIYSVCGGYKPTYMGFVWRKREKTKPEIAA